MRSICRFVFLINSSFVGFVFHSGVSNVLFSRFATVVGIFGFFGGLLHLVNTRKERRNPNQRKIGRGWALFGMIFPVVLFGGLSCFLLSLFPDEPNSQNHLHLFFKSFLVLDISLLLVSERKNNQVWTQNRNVGPSSF